MNQVMDNFPLSAFASLAMSAECAAASGAVQIHNTVNDSNIGNNNNNSNTNQQQLANNNNSTELVPCFDGHDGGGSDALAIVEKESDKEKCKGRRGRKPRQVGRIVKNPEWLPTGWITEIKIRDGGVSHGGIDRFFYDPITNHRFRSKREVLNFIETGKLRHQVLKQKKEELSALGQLPPGGRLRAPRSTSSQPRPSHIPSSKLPPLSLPRHMRSSKSAPSNRTLDSAGNRKTTKVRWVLVGPEGSWEPQTGDDDTVGVSSRESESAIDLNCHSTDGSSQEQFYTPQFREVAPEAPRNDATGQIDLNIARQGSSVVSPVRESWPDPFGETIPVSPYFF